MNVRTVGERLFVALLVFVAIALVAGQALGQPVLLGFVETGSMSPTLEPGDGFVAVPSALTTVEEGDVVVFEGEEIQGGGLTTHRIVEETDRGYVTKGDANPFTDQESGEPPVKEAQIVATALQVNGQVLVVPHLGTVVEGVQSMLEEIQRLIAGLVGSRSLLGVQGLAYLFFATTLVWYVVGEWRAKNSKRHERDRSRETGIDARLIVGAFAAVLVVGATAAMVVPAGSQEYGVVSAEFESEDPTVIPMGESNDVTYPVGNGGIVPVVVSLEPASDGVEVRPQELTVGRQSVANATVTLHAPPETGYYRRFVVEHRYLAVLPGPVIRSLYRVHPWAPIVAIDAVLAVPFYLLGLSVAGTGRVRNRSRDRDVSLSTRLRRVVKSFY